MIYGILILIFPSDFKWKNDFVKLSKSVIILICYVLQGGREHGVPILISELESNGPAARSGSLYVGDAIMSVNGITLKQVINVMARSYSIAFVSWKKRLSSYMSGFNMQGKCIFIYFLSNSIIWVFGKVWVVCNQSKCAFIRNI